MSPVVLSKPQKAAVVVAQLDAVHANKLLRSMSENEVVDLMSAVANLPALDTRDVEDVLHEFAGKASSLMKVGQGGLDIARKLLRERLGALRADEILDELVQSNRTHPLAFLHRIEPQQIVGFLNDEHPQLVAVVLAHLPADHAAEVLRHLDEEKRVDVARRIATMGKITPSVIQNMALILEKKLSSVLRAGGTSYTEVGGVSTIVGILSQSDRASEKQILSGLEDSDPDLAEEIRNEMFVFDDVTNLDDRTLQKVLRNIVPKDLAVALKGVSELVRDKFMRNISERAAQDLNEEIELLGPTRLSQVEAAQKAIVKIVRDLEAAGEITLARSDDEFV